MWQRMVRVWLLGTAVAVASLDGAPPDLSAPPEARVEQPGGEAAAGPPKVEPDDQGIRT